MNIADQLGFDCFQTENGVWCKRRPDGRRGMCVADEAKLWQALLDALAMVETLQRERVKLDLPGLVKENEGLTKDCERMVRECDELRLACRQWKEEYDKLEAEALHLRANQRQKPGRKPRSGAAGADEQAVAAPEQEDL